MLQDTVDISIYNQLHKAIKSQRERKFQSLKSHEIYPKVRSGDLLFNSSLKSKRNFLVA